MEFKKRLRQIRHERKITQGELGELLGFGYTAIANYESGRNEPSIYCLKRLATILGVSIDYLVGFSDIPNPTNRFFIDP